MGVLLQDALWFSSLGNAQARGWTASGTVTYVTDPTYTRAVRIAGGVSNASIRRALGGGAGDYSVHARALVSSLRETYRLLSLRDATNSSPFCGLSVTRTGAVQVIGSNSVVLATSAHGIVREARWHRFRLQVDSWGDTASILVHVDGQQVLSLTGDTGSSAILPAHLFLYGPDASMPTTDYAQFSGVQVRAPLGGDECPYDQVISDFRFQQLRPTGDDENAWTKSTGTTSWGVTDDGSDGDGDLDGNGDTDYIYGPPVDRSLVTFPDAAAGTSAIHGVCGLIAAKKTDTGSVSVGWYFKRGSSVHSASGTEFVPGTSYGVFSAQHDVDPTTSAQWDVTGANALAFGVGDRPM